MINTDATSSPETLILDDNPQTAGAGNADIGGGAPTSTPSLQENSSSSSPSGGGFSSGAKVAVGVGGAVAVFMMLVCALFYYWRQRKNRREEQELDRLYGVKNTMSAGGDFTSSGDIPGWYRGQRLATPPERDLFREGTGARGVVEVQRPAPAAAPYYKPYRPGS